MRKFTRVMLILAGIMVGISVMCLLGAFALGLNGNSFRNMVHSGKFSFDIDDVDKGWGSISKDSMTIDKTCKNLDIEVGAGKLEIYYADVDKIEIEQNNMPGFRAHIDGNTLCIESSAKIHTSSDAWLTIVIPRDMRFNEVDLEVGASEAEIRDLVSKTINIEVGAGDAKISNLDVVEMDAEVGVGRLWLELVGNKNDYNYSVECGIGSVEVGDTVYAGLGTSKIETNIGAARYVDLECGIGEVKVSFME